MNRNINWEDKAKEVLEKHLIEGEDRIHNSINCIVDAMKEYAEVVVKSRKD